MNFVARRPYSAFRLPPTAEHDKQAAARAAVARMGARVRRMQADAAGMPIGRDVAFARISGLIVSDNVCLRELREELARKPAASEICISIDSRGGNLGLAREIFSLLRRHGGKVVARVIDKCGSAATVIMLSADYREAWPDTQFLVHQVEIEPDRRDRWTADTHVAAAAQLRESNQELAKFYRDRTGRDIKIWQQEMAHEQPLDAKRAMSLGLIHSIVGAP